ncbi:MAG: hypothetical protein ACI814_001251 [Mariniblastus sp.]|jgi:hypothetical protein
MDVDSIDTWKGSHRHLGTRERLRELIDTPNSEGSVRPLPKMGHVYLMGYRVVHGCMANDSLGARPILYRVFSRPGLKDTYKFQEQPPIRFVKGERKKVPK